MKRAIQFSGDIEVNRIQKKINADICKIFAVLWLNLHISKEVASFFKYMLGNLIISKIEQNLDGYWDDLLNFEPNIIKKLTTFASANIFSYVFVFSSN